MIRTNTLCLKKRPTLSFTIALTVPIRLKFGRQKEETQRYKTHVAILNLFHFYLFNFSYKSDVVLLCHSCVTAVFMNMAFSIQRWRQDFDQAFVYFV